MPNKPPQEEDIRAKQARILRRKALMKALSTEVNFCLVEKMLQSEQPIIVDLDFAASFFPGFYVRQLIEQLHELQGFGIVSVTVKSMQEATYQRGVIYSKPQDDIAVEFLDTVYR